MDYSSLKRYCIELGADAVVHEQGVVPSYVYLLLAGHVSLEVLDDRGVRSVIGEVGPGEPFGVEAVFSGRPALAAARTTERSTLVAIPAHAAAEAFQLAPELPVTLLRHLARAAHPGDELDLSQAEPEAGAMRDGGLPEDASGFNEQWFFTSETACPVCEERFTFLQVRASAVRPANRDTDFRVAYNTVDPSWYAVTVCPHCAYANYEEEFEVFDPAARRALAVQREERLTLLATASDPLCGERDLDAAVLSIELALRCAEARNLGWRRRAGLLHRLTWIERSRGDVAAERALLERTLEAYLRLYQEDPDIQDASVMRVSYIIGDLHRRLGNIDEARSWLLTCVQAKDAGAQEGLLRMARFLLEEIREQQLRGLAQSA